METPVYILPYIRKAGITITELVWGNLQQLSVAWCLHHTVWKSGKISTAMIEQDRGSIRILIYFLDQLFSTEVFLMQAKTLILLRKGFEEEEFSIIYL